MKKYFFLTLAVLATLVFTSCSKKDDPAKSSHTIVFKAKTSSDAHVDTAIYGYDSKVTTASSLSGATWASPEVSVPAGATMANVVVNGIGTGASSTLKVEIYVDGQLKAEGTSSGEALSASASFKF
jgi:hypothetical protein